MRPFGEWPLILCGPILRRVQGGSVSVFVALKHPRKVTLSLFEGAQKTASPIVQHIDETIQLGLYLHVILITAELTQGNFLQPGNIYGYDLQFENLPGQADDAPGNASLSDLGQFQVEPITYGNADLPTFALPPDDTLKLRLFHASCRKPHADGQDVFPTLDKVISDSHTDPLLRPHQLFLTGDQIYADDVAPALLRLTTAVGTAASGWNSLELIPGVFDPSPSNPLGTTTTDHFELAPERRMKLVNDSAGLTSGHSNSHLVTLAEYYGMYLLVFSNELWPRNSDGDPDLPTENEVFDNPKWHEEQQQFEDEHPTRGYPPIKSKYEKAIEQYGKTISRLKEFVIGLANVRRALANVPTYMLFDDHEVTDDWNLNGAWVDRVHNKPMGKRIIQNALSAYAIFQAWGNDFRQFKLNQPGRELLHELGAWDGSEGVTSGLICSYLKLPTLFPQLPVNTLRWDFSLKFSTYQVIALDTRTNRVFPPSADHDGPELMGGSEISYQVEQHYPQASASIEFTIIISPAPVMGHGLIEGTLQPLGVKVQNAIAGALGTVNWFRSEVAPFLLKLPVTRVVFPDIQPGEEENDYESWAANPFAFQNFLKALVPFGRVLILSGDVHYGFSAAVQYWDERTAVEKRAIFAQLTSSGLRNENSLTRGLGMLQPSNRRLLGWTQPGEWLKTNVGYKKMVQGDVGAAIWEHIGDEGPVGLLEPSETVEGHAPEWRFRVLFSRDPRDDEERGTYDLAYTVLPESAVYGPLENHTSLANEHKKRKETDQMRGVVGHNNFGEVKLVKKANDEQVIRHSLWYFPAGILLPIEEHLEEALVLPYTVHEVPFEVPRAEDPKPDVTQI
jgi:hypothetical protein